MGQSSVSLCSQVSQVRPSARRARQVSSWNETELLSILSQLKVEELNSLNDWLDNAPPYRLALTMQRGEEKQELSVYDHYLALWDMREHVTYYYLPTKPDWKVIIQTLK